MDPHASSAFRGTRAAGCTNVGVLLTARRLLNPLTIPAMFPSFLDVNDRFDRFQRLLLAMHVGEELRPRDAADATGLSLDVCQAVLERLERVGLMSRQSEDLFVRRRLDITTTA
jgi:hypothetical protein